MQILSAFIVFSLLFSISTSNEVENRNNDTLILTHVMLRHGDRNPLPESIYPTDPWGDPIYWPEGSYHIEFYFVDISFCINLFHLFCRSR